MCVRKGSRYRSETLSLTRMLIIARTFLGYPRQSIKEAIPQEEHKTFWGLPSSSPPHNHPRKNLVNQLTATHSGPSQRVPIRARAPANHHSQLVCFSRVARLVSFLRLCFYEDTFANLVDSFRNLPCWGSATRARVDTCVDTFTVFYFWPPFAWFGVAWCKMVTNQLLNTWSQKRRRIV